MALLIGPVVALLGIVCMYYVIRGRAKSRTSLYTARRTLLQARTAERRQRALGGSPAGSVAALDPTPAPASAAAVAEAAPTMVTPGAMPVVPAEAAWEQSPTRPQPAAPPPPPPPPLEAQPAGPAPNQPEAWPPAPPPPPGPPTPPAPAFPEPAMPAAAAPAAPVDWPSSTAQVEPPPAPPAEQVPIEPTMPAAEAPWEPAPAPAEPPAFEPAAAVPAEAPAQAPPFVPPEPEPPIEPAKPVGAGWSIVGQGGEEISADEIGAEPARGAVKEDKKGKKDKGRREEEEKVPVGAASGAAWDVVPHARARREELNLGDVPDAPKESVGMTLLSYAGLVGALVVVLLGVLLMVATSR